MARYQLPDGRIVEDAPGGGYNVVSGPPQGLGGGQRLSGPDPRKAAAEERAQAAADRAANADARQAAAAERAARNEERALTKADKEAADPKTSESEKTAAFLATRLAGALQDIKRVGAPQADQKPSMLSGLAGMFGGTARNLANNEDRQRIEAAQEDAIDSALTLGTGAAYSKEQLVGYRQGLFPQIGDKPATIADKTRRFERMISAARLKAGAAAPLIDKAIGEYNAPAKQDAAAPVADVDKSTVLQAAPGNDQRAIATGATRSEPDDATSSALDKMIREGRSSTYINAYLKGNGSDPVSAASVAAAQAYLKTPAGKAFTGSMGSATRTVPQSLMDRASVSPLASLVTGAAGAATGGFNDEIKGALQTAALGGNLSDNIANANAEKQGLAALNPKSNLLGNVVGGIGAQVSVGALASKFPALAAAAAKAPALLRNIGASPLVRDVAQGAVYGAGENNDNRTLGALIGGGAAGAGGSILRQATGAAGAVFSGVKADASRRLAAQGIPLTGGQIMRDRGGVLGSTIGGIEDGLTSVPGVGELISERRNDGLRAMNQAVFDKAGKPIGYQASGVGAEGLDALNAAKGDAYSNSLGNMNLRVDPQLGTELAPAAVAGTNLPGSLKDQFEATMRKVAGFIDPTTGMIPGRAVQAIKQTIRAEKAASQGAPGGQFLVDALRPADDAFMGLAARQAPDAFSGYQAADATHGMSKVLEKAVNSASGKSGDPGVFGGAQLANGLKGSKVTGATHDELDQLARDAVRVLPSQLGDSGSAKRLMLGLGSTGALGAGGVAAPAAIGPGAALGGLAAILNSKIGQQVVQGALIGDRGAALTQFGNGIKSLSPYAGMLGSNTAAPWLLQSQ